MMNKPNDTSGERGGGSLERMVGPIGDREAYELDVREAQSRYDAHPSSMNHEDLYAAKQALRRHWPNDTLCREAGKKDAR